MKTINLMLACLLFLVLFPSIAQNKNELPMSGATPEINKMLRDAWTLYADAKTADAREMLEKVKNQDPEFALAYLYQIPADAKKNLEDLKQALNKKINPDEKILLEGRMAALEKKLAPGHFDPLIKKYPQDKQIMLAISYQFNSGGDRKRGAEILNNLIKKFPDFSQAYNIRGYNYMAAKEMDKAGADFDKYISLRPDLANVYDSKADYLMRIDKTEEAIALYEKAATMDPRNHTASGTKAENAKNKLYGFKIPERTLEQKHNRMVGFSYNGVLAGIVLAKKSGLTADDYGRFCGELFKTSWNKAGGFEGFVRGALFNFESQVRKQDAPIEILKQDINRVEFKVQINYQDSFKGSPKGVSEDEFASWLLSTYSVIGEYMGAKFEQEVQDEFLKIVITRNQPN